MAAFNRMQRLVRGADAVADRMSRLWTSRHVKRACHKAEARHFPWFLQSLRSHHDPDTYHSLMDLFISAMDGIQSTVKWGARPRDMYHWRSSNTGAWIRGVVCRALRFPRGAGRWRIIQRERTRNRRPFRRATSAGRWLLWSALPQGLSQYPTSTPACILSFLVCV